MNDEELFNRLHQGLPQQGPGSDATTKRALDLLPPVPSGARLLDMGCGPGRQTLALARFTEALITAVDQLEPFLQELTARIQAAGLDSRVRVVQDSMLSDRFQGLSVDGIWSEGAIYSVGFLHGLRAWSGFLKDEGWVALTECSWLTDDPPAEAREFWNRSYPEMGTVAANLERARQAGFDELSHFVLPESDWWRDYYDPLSQRHESLRQEHRSSPGILRALDGFYEEIDIYRRYSQSYGYVFYLLIKKG